MQYEERLVAFLDILGFKEIIKKTESETKELENLISLLRRIKDGVEKLKNEDENSTDIRMSVFSDSIIISAALASDVDMFAGQLLRTNIWLLEQGYFVRGGIDYGKVYHREDTVFGPAFIRAYELEKIADYPRIILSEKAKEKLHHEKNENTIAVKVSSSYFKKDCDGLYYLDYFTGSNSDGYDFFLNNLEKMTNNNMSENIGNESIVKKMEWIKNKILFSNSGNSEREEPFTLPHFLNSVYNNTI